MKRILTSILVVTLLVCGGAGLIPTQAADAEQSGTCGEALTWTLENGTLTVSGTGEMEDYTVLNPPSDGTKYYYTTSTAPWYGSNASIRTVRIAEGVTGIGDLAFAGCRNLRHVTIPDGVRRIGESAFADCSSLTEAAIPNGVTRLGRNLFFRCESLARVTIPDSVTEVGDFAFSQCYSLANLAVPDSVTEIGEWAFFRVGNVIYNGSASGCPWEGNVNKYAEGAYVFDSAAKKALLWCGKSVQGDVAIPDGVSEIGDFAFYLCKAVTGVTIPDSVTVIGDVAFADCVALARVTFSSGLQHIGYCAFSGCTSLTQLTVPDSVTQIESEAFHGCTGLTDVTLGSGLTEIESGVFDACSCLENVTIPSDVTQIGSFAFYACDALQNVYYGGTKAQWDNITIDSHNDALTGATVTYGSRTSTWDLIREALQKAWSWLLQLIRLIRLILGQLFPF